MPFTRKNFHSRFSKILVNFLRDGIFETQKIPFFRLAPYVIASEKKLVCTKYSKNMSLTLQIQTKNLDKKGPVFLHSLYKQD